MLQLHLTLAAGRYTAFELYLWYSKSNKSYFGKPMQTLNDISLWV